MHATAKRLATLLAVLLALTTLTPVRSAAARPGEIQQRFNRQQQRINNGVATGQLTHREAVNDERHLRQDEALRQRQRLQDGGNRLTPAQRARDNQLLNNNSQRIYDTKHNGATAAPGH